MQVFVMLRLFGNGVRMPKHHFHNIFGDRFSDIHLIRSRCRIDRSEILCIDTQVKQLQSQQQSNEAGNMLSGRLHEILCKITHFDDAMNVKEILKRRLSYI
ncbi:MAG: hypothetical protein JWQ78_820 [Sediminibacterium sp.]|nr:hypothetical protein [Sediminibacterium sp.]